jgi:hypothetical protein
MGPPRVPILVEIVTQKWSLAAFIFQRKERQADAIRSSPSSGHAAGFSIRRADLYALLDDYITGHSQPSQLLLGSSTVFTRQPSRRLLLPCISRSNFWP